MTASPGSFKLITRTDCARESATNLGGLAHLATCDCNIPDNSKPEVRTRSTHAIIAVLCGAIIGAQDESLPAARKCSGGVPCRLRCVRYDRICADCHRNRDALGMGARFLVSCRTS